jgi:hypothetical protein
LDPGTFAKAYASNQEAATQVALESSPVVTALLKLMQNHTCIEYTASELLHHLGVTDSAFSRMPGWPKTPRVLSQILKRVAPNLREIGIVAVQDTRGGGNKKEKIWRITEEGVDHEVFRDPVHIVKDYLANFDPSDKTLETTSLEETLEQGGLEIVDGMIRTRRPTTEQK